MFENVAKPSHCVNVFFVILTQKYKTLKHLNLYDETLKCFRVS